MTMTVQIGIIGGSGLYDMAELTDREEKSVSTPFGDPSGPYRDRRRSAESGSRSSPATASAIGSCRRS